MADKKAFHRIVPFFVVSNTYQQPVENPGIRTPVCLPVSPVEKIFFCLFSVLPFPGFLLTDTIILCG